MQNPAWEHSTHTGIPAVNNMSLMNNLMGLNIPVPSNQHSMAALNSSGSSSQNGDQHSFNRRRRSRSRSRERSLDVVRDRNRKFERDRTEKRQRSPEKSSPSDSQTLQPSIQPFDINQMNLMMMQNNMLGMGMSLGQTINPQAMMVPEGMMMPGIFGANVNNDINPMESSGEVSQASLPGQQQLMQMMMMDPSVMQMQIASQNEPIKLKRCTLIPPFPGFVELPRHDRPPGCRTVFVGGLPTAIERDALREIFERFGKIHSIRFNKKTFCHVRYDLESSVEASFAISGYRIRLNEGDKEQCTGSNLHIDYAQSRDDQQEFERRAAREMREANRDDGRQSNRQRSPSPLRVLPLTSMIVANTIAEQIKTEEQFTAAAPTLIAWLERGEVTKKNANMFYSMIQSTSGQSRRLLNEKLQLEEEYQTAKDKFKEKFQHIIVQFEQVEKILTAASHQRVSDHMTKPQRSRINTWLKMNEEIQSLKEEFAEKFDDDYMDLEDEKKSKKEFKNLKSENDKLKMELEAYKNEIEVMRAESNSEMEKFKAQFTAKIAMERIDVGSFAMDRTEPKPSPPVNEVFPGEARLLTLLSAFLGIHPQGASSDYLMSYIQSIIPRIEPSKVDGILNKHPDVFQRRKLGVGANLEHRWHYIAFNCDNK